MNAVVGIGAQRPGISRAALAREEDRSRLTAEVPVTRATEVVVVRTSPGEDADALPSARNALGSLA
jgi:hypothetical protein